MKMFSFRSFSGQIEEFLHEEDALMDFLKHQASYCDVVKSVVEKHEQLIEDNVKQETSLDLKRNQRDSYVKNIFKMKVSFRPRCFLRFRRTAK